MFGEKEKERNENDRASSRATRRVRVISRYAKKNGIVLSIFQSFSGEEEIDSTAIDPSKYCNE